ncbi:META domain-containing protein [Corynebacterium sp. H130]|uniref:META domain-containing protein n=1 Tax=Corynebacterium sp. H130 TaxID=3133444 RepID=UPI00309CF379
MRKLLAALACACALSACSTDIPMSTTWQITNVYVSDQFPSQVPEPAYLVFGGSTVTGSTGCSQIQGRVHFSPNADQPEKASFSDMNFQDPTCEGSQRFFHDQLTNLLAGEFEVKKSGDELLLTKTGEFDRQGVRLVASN